MSPPMPPATPQAARPAVPALAAPIDVPLKRLSFCESRRRDLWWVKTLVVFAALTAFVVYSTWAALQNAHYTFGPYLSPMYSPELWGSSPHAWFGHTPPSWYPSWLPWSPALIILWMPGGFRLTCYDYRGAYYKSLWASPPACAVGKPQKRYRGEQKLPLLIQNVHRYFLYLALAFLVVLAYDAYKGFFHWGADHHFELRVGGLVLLLNVILLGGYTFGCHSLRHLVGGRHDEMSRRPLAKRMWQCATCFNRRHQAWAWASLLWVAWTDIYVRLCSMGVLSDWRII
jgi:hypothetical protein